MRRGRVGRGLGVTAVTLAVVLVAATGCAASSRAGATDPTTTVASTTTSTAPRSGEPARPTVPPPVAATDNGSLTGTWVTGSGDVLDFVRTAPGTYRGTVLFANRCAPGAGPVEVTSQAASRYVGTGPLGPGSTGWCGAKGSAPAVTIVVAPGGSTARAATQVWTRTTLTVTGDISPPGPNNEDQAVGSSALAKTCDRSRFDSYRLNGSVIATSFRLGRAAGAATLLTHFLDGTGTPTNFPASSAVAAEVAQYGAFQQEVQRVQAYASSQLRQGVKQIDAGEGQNVLSTIDFADQSIPDLFLAFRKTQGISVTGAAALVGSQYVGELTFVIMDAYGFGVHDYLFGAGAQMRYLQTVCGAPYYPGGAHWFRDSVTVTVGLRVPVQATG